MSPKPSLYLGLEKLTNGKVRNKVYVLSILLSKKCQKDLFDIVVGFSPFVEAEEAELNKETNTAEATEIKSGDSEEKTEMGDAETVDSAEEEGKANNGEKKRKGQSEDG